MRPHISFNLANTAQQRGLTLIELLVSLVIGLLLAIVASSTYLYSKQAYNAVSETSQVEENGRFALTMLARNIQTAGYVSIDKATTAAPGPSDLKIQGCDFGMVRPQSPTTSADLACQPSTPAGVSRSSSISAFYDTDAFGAASTSFQGFDCLGNAPVPVVNAVTGNTTYQVRNYFYVSTTNVQTPGGTTTMGQLSCVTDPTGGSGPAASGFSPGQPLIAGVQQIGVTYLTGSLLEKTAAQTRNTAAAITAAAAWPKVLAVELCVLTKSVQASGNDSGSQVTDCFGNTFTPPQYQSFRRFTTTVNLRNRTSG